MTYVDCQPGSCERYRTLCKVDHKEGLIDKYINRITVKRILKTFVKRHHVVSVHLATVMLR